MKLILEIHKEIRLIVIAFIVISLLITGSKLISIYQISLMKNLTDTIYEHPLKVSNAALMIRSDLFKIHRDIKDIALTQSEKEIQQKIREMDIDERDVYANLNIIRKNILGENGLKIEQDAEILFSEWKPIRQEVIRLVQNGQRLKAIDLINSKGNNHVLKLEVSTLKLYAYARDKANSFKNYSDTKYYTMKILSILIGCTILIFLIFYSLLHCQ